MASTSTSDTPSSTAEMRPYDLPEDTAGPPEPDHPSHTASTPVQSTPLATTQQPVAIARTPASPTPPARESAPPLREPTTTRRGGDEGGVDGLVEQLQAMFTTLDRETIEDVLASNRGNPDASVPQLLELTGQVGARAATPTTPTATTRSPEDDLRRAQEMADAEYARQLMQEEAQAAQQYGGLNYEPRRTRPGAQAEQEGPPQPGHRDDLDQAFDQLKQGVEKGRQVATGWFNKASAFAKEKMAQLDQPKQDEQPGQSSGSFQLPSSSSSAQDYSRAPTTPAAQSTPRTAPALPYGDRYSRPSAPPKGFSAASPAAPPTFASSSRDAEPASSQRITMIDNSQKDAKQDRRADDSDDDELEYTKSPFEED